MRMLLLCSTILLAGTSGAAEAPLPTTPEVQVPVSAEAAYLTGRPQSVRISQLDEAIFTDISPLTVPEQAIRMPEDQQE